MTGFSIGDTILIGDRLDTDIVLAKQQNIFQFWF